MKSEQIYMRAPEVAAELGVSVAYAYKVIRTLNKELEARGYIILQGQVDRKFFHEKMYATRDERREENDASI